MISDRLVASWPNGSVQDMIPYAVLAGMPYAGEFPKVAKWLNVLEDELIFRKVEIPVSDFLLSHEKRLIGISRFPADARRVKRIRQLLYGGQELWPVFVEEGDPDLFVMEGRHRSLAFLQIGMATIPCLMASVVR